MPFNNGTESYICLNMSFSFTPNNVFLKHVVSQNLFQWWFAITSDSNPVLLLGEVHRQKDDCSKQRHELLYIRAFPIWCTLKCIISGKRREVFLTFQILFLQWFFGKVFDPNLVVPWFLKIKQNLKPLFTTLPLNRW